MPHIQKYKLLEEQIPIVEPIIKALLKFKNPKNISELETIEDYINKNHLGFGKEILKKYCGKKPIDITAYLINSEFSTRQELFFYISQQPESFKEQIIEYLKDSVFVSLIYQKNKNNLNNVYAKTPANNNPFF